MWRLIVGALRARRGQSTVLFLLAVLAVATSTAAPMYADGARRAARLDEALVAGLAGLALAAMAVTLVAGIEREPGSRGRDLDALEARLKLSQ
jgi:hypothetical protein